MLHTLFFLGLCLALALLTREMMQILAPLAHGLHLEKTNYQGKHVPDLGGALWVASLAGYTLMALVDGPRRSSWVAFVLVAFVSGFLGLIDDRYGSHPIGGFRGHFGALLRGRLTTGAVKALFMPPAALFVAMTILDRAFWSALLIAILVSLWANSINMLDIRPGRAVTGWLIACLAFGLGALSTGSVLSPLWLMMGPVLVYLPVDADRHGMLGDTGANLLGAILGLQIALRAPCRVGIAVMVVLVLLHVAGEELRDKPGIADGPWLRWLDVFSRIHAPDGQSEES